MIKDVHVATVLISISFFIVRFFWMVSGSKLLTIKPVKILPHINDTVLLISAIVLAVKIEQYPFVDHWLTVKVVALLAYIVIGTVALKRGKTKNARIAAGFIAIFIFIFMMSVAGTRDPAGFLSALF